MSFKYPEPPTYYKLFEESPDKLEAPDLNLIQEINHEYWLFQKPYPVRKIFQISYVYSSKKTIKKELSYRRGLRSLMIRIGN